ncbi:MAG: UDP-N-acetylglucosamine 2-epimerase (non-hydrolyzing) [Prevotella sp.]|jgi:UDP-N-acetylglucosamine 2-epimerase|nr:UDP-N-acetylglucosamine 2-epimerase (non-hydrolyzing) [Prevotella sp.]
MKLMLIVGVRPHFVKITILLRKLEDYFDVVLVHTGQHYDYNLSDVFFNDLQIRKPDYHIGISNNQAGEQLLAIGQEIAKLINKEKPEFVLVIGDSNTPFIAAQTAFHSNVPVGHIEAGVRNFDDDMVEEINRVFIDNISAVHFAQTYTEISNLENEGIKSENIHCVGDLLLEVILKKQSILKQQALKGLNIESKGFILLTVHRKENTDNVDNLRWIVDCVNRIDERIIFPMHPRTKNALQQNNLFEKITTNKNITVMNPLSYPDILWAQKNSRYVITDSNGVQRESYFLHTPSIILRNSTEVLGTLKNSCSILAKYDTGIFQSSIDFFGNCPELVFDSSEFGDGNTSQYIAEILYQFHEQR